MILFMSRKRMDRIIREVVEKERGGCKEPPLDVGCTPIEVRWCGFRKGGTPTDPALLFGKSHLIASTCFDISTTTLADLLQGMLSALSELGMDYVHRSGTRDFTGFCKREAEVSSAGNENDRKPRERKRAAK